MTKQERLRFLKELIETYSIETQEEIVERLRQGGFEVTQATVSRDMKGLGITKIPLSDNRYIYGFIGQSAMLSREKIVYVRDFSYQGEMVHIQVVPGTSAVVKRQIKERCAASLFSVISDDDSLLVVLRPDADRDLLESTLKEL